MNSKSLLLLLPVLTGTLAAAPIDIGPGITVYSQNFNTLPTATNNNVADTPWSDDSTIPGWYLYSTGTAANPLGFAGAAFPWYVGDGSVAPTAAPLAHAYYSYGAAADPDRALGDTSTTNQGEQSAIVLFRNATASGVRLTNVKFNVEVYRHNSTGGNEDSFYMWYRTAPDVATATTITTAAATAAVFPPAVSTGPTSLYISGWTQLDQFRHTQSDPATGQITPPAVFPFNAAPATSVVIPPGQILAIRWSNINDGGADAMMGLDDLELTFSEVGAVLTPSVTGIVRDPGANAADPADDTITFDLTVTATGAFSPLGWTVPAGSPVAPGATGAYGAPVHLTRPLSEFLAGSGTASFTVQDAADANSSANVVVVAPKFVPAVSATFSPGMTFTAPAVGATSFTNPFDSFVELGWANTTATSLVEAQPNITPNPNKYFKHTGAVAIMTSEPVSLKLIGGQAVELEVKVGAYTTSTSGLENTDVITVNLEVALDGDFANTAPGNVLTQMVTGADGVTPPLADQWGADIAVANPYINLGVVGYPTTPFQLHTFKQSIPVPAASAATAMARLVFNSSVGITSEHVLLDDVVFRAVTSDVLTVSTPAGITRNPNGPGVGDDTVSFTVDISGLGISGQWNATGSSVTPASGAYGNGVVLTVPAGAAVNQATVTVTDSVNAALTKTFTVRFEPIYVIGNVDLGAGQQDLLSVPVVTANQGWTNDTAAKSISVTNAGAAAKTITSETVNVSGVNSVVTFTLGIRDTSSGFEAADEFRVSAILNGDTVTPINLVTSNEAGLYDDGAPVGVAPAGIATVANDGILSGGELAPVGTPAYTVANPFTRDYTFRYTVPPNTTSVAVSFTTTADSGNEFVTISNLFIGTSNFADADGDLMSDSYEDANGLNKNDPADKLTDLDSDGQNNYAEYLAGTAANDAASTLRIIDAGLSAIGEVSLTWTSVPGKRYRARVSTDLGATNPWTNLGTTVTATGATTSIPPGNIVPPGLSPRYFMRIEVVP